MWLLFVCTSLVATSFSIANALSQTKQTATLHIQCLHDAVHCLSQGTRHLSNACLCNGAHSMTGRQLSSQTQSNGVSCLFQAPQALLIPFHDTRHHYPHENDWPRLQVGSTEFSHCKMINELHHTIYPRMLVHVWRSEVKWSMNFTTLFIRVCWCMCGGQRTTSRNQFSPSMWVLVKEVRLPVLAASA